MNFKLIGVEVEGQSVEVSGYGKEDSVMSNCKKMVILPTLEVRW
jgi:hypothetical protein